MSLQFRNLTVTPDDPVQMWGAEGIATAIDRGFPKDWRKIILAVDADPYGSVAADLEEALEIAESPGITALMRDAISQARESSRDRLTRRLNELFRGAEMTQARYADEIGTSRTRLNSYLSGKVVPSAEMLIRMERVTERRQRAARGDW